MKKRTVRTALSLLLCCLTAIGLFTLTASADIAYFPNGHIFYTTEFDDPNFVRLYNELEDGEMANITIWLNGPYLVPEFDESKLEREYRLKYVLENDLEHDPLVIYLTEAGKRAIPILSQYMEISERDVKNEMWLDPVLHGKATKENILKLTEMPEVDTVYFLSTYSNAEDDRVIGDADNNGKVTAADARIALRVSANLASIDPLSQGLIDLDGDGKVTAAEARKILRASARLETL